KPTCFFTDWKQILVQDIDLGGAKLTGTAVAVSGPAQTAAQPYAPTPHGPIRRRFDAMLGEMNRLQRSSSGLGDHVAGRLVDREAGGRLEHPSYSYPTDVQRLMIEIDRLPVIDTTATPYHRPLG
ncbi:MAG: hypothetical protein ACE5GB_10280, partial [Acidimicrobiales bacterium]